MVRWLAGLTILLSACSYTVPAEGRQVSPVDLTREADMVITSLDAIGAQIDSNVSEDLAMAWGDLEGDLRSVVNDVLDRPDSVDLEGVKHRIEGFVSRFSGTDQVDGLTGHWDRLLSSVAAMANRVTVAGRVGSS